MKKILVTLMTIASFAATASDCSRSDAVKAVKAYIVENYQISNELKATALLNKNDSQYTVVYTYTDEIVGYNKVSKIPTAGFFIVEKSSCKVNEEEESDSGILE